jgi:hypothetical protein
MAKIRDEQAQVLGWGMADPFALFANRAGRRLTTQLVDIAVTPALPFVTDPSMWSVGRP